LNFAATSTQAKTREDVGHLKEFSSHCWHKATSL